MIVDDIWLHAISKFLGLDGLNSMRSLNKKFRDNIGSQIKKGLLRKRVEKWLSERVPNFDAFCEILRATGSIISGSCILTALMPEIPSNDIDVYTYTKDRSHCEHFLRAASGEEKGLHDNSFQTTEGYDHSILPIEDVLDIHIGGNVFQIIRCSKVPCQMPLDFDLDVAMNWYDGRRLKISCPNELAGKQATVVGQKSSTRERVQCRILSYKFKGFNVKCDFDRIFYHYDHDHDVSLRVDLERKKFLQKMAHLREQIRNMEETLTFQAVQAMFHQREC